MTKIVIGSAQFGLNYGISNTRGQVDEIEVSRLLAWALDHGINEIDTAKEYGNSEEILGRCLKKFPNKFLLHSKFLLKEKSIQDEIFDSCDLLGTERLGYFYFHRFLDFEKSMNNLPMQLKQCKGLAVSVYDEKEMAMALKSSEIKAIQLPLNLLDTSPEKIEQINQAQGLGKKIYIRSVFLQGLFFLAPEKIPTKLQSLKPVLNALREIGHDYKVSMRELALLFVKNIVTAEGIILGVENTEQLKENIAAFSGTISQSAIADIQKIVVPNKELLLPKNW